MARRPPHFKVFTSAANHPKMAEVYGDNRLLALWVRLGVLAIERYADRTADSFIVHDRELCSLTGVGRADVARTLLERLANVSPISAEPDGNIWRITFRNFAKKQFFRDGNGTGTGSPSSSASTSSSNTPLPPASGGRARRRKRPNRSPSKRPPSEVPELLTDEERERLRAWADSKEPWAVPRLADFEAACLGHFAVKRPSKLPADWVRAVQNWIRNDRLYAERDGRPHASQEYEREQRRQAAHAAYLEREKQREAAEASAEYPDLADIFDNSDLEAPH